MSEPGLAPTTRSLPQCTYVTLPQPADTPPARPFEKLAMLRAAAPRKDTLEVLPDTAKSGNAKMLRGALYALHDGDVRSAVSTVVNVSVDDVATYARSLLDAERAAMSTVHTDLRTVWSGVAESKQGPRPMVPGEVRVLTPDVLPETTRLVLNAVGLLPAQPGVPLAVRADASPRYEAAPDVVSVASRATAAVADMDVLIAAHAQQIQRRYSAIEALRRAVAFEPVGMLYLERLDLTPSGYVDGDLIYSLTLLPGESVRMTHREWTRTETDYSKLVSTSIETETEDSLSEKSELAESTQVQRQHAQAFNASLSATGGFGPVSITASASFGINDSESTNVSHTVRRTREATHRASSRAKQEHKLSFRVTTTTEVEDTTARELRNDSTDAIRWDYHRLMCRWTARLYRYDERLTYDLVVPEPGSYLLRKHVELARIAQELANPRPSLLRPSLVVPENWTYYRDLFGAGVEPPPPDQVPVQGAATVTYAGSKIRGTAYVELAAPDGYEYDPASFSVDAPPVWHGGNNVGQIQGQETENRNRMRGAGGRFSWQFTYNWGPENPANGQTIDIRVTGRARRSAHALAAWSSAAFAKLRDAEQAQRDAEVQRLQTRQAQLLDDLGALDTLRLRKLEKEELMKGVLRWLFGPSFDLFPHSVDITQLPGEDLSIYDHELGTVLREAYQPLLEHGDLIRFLHQAVEWENVMYVLYPYFWTDPGRWDFKQSLTFGDDLHWSFLRAGAARVVLTIRPDFVGDWLRFVAGSFGRPLPRGHAYLTIAEELRTRAVARDGTSPASVPTSGRLLAEWTDHTPTGAVSVRRHTS